MRTATHPAFFVPTRDGAWRGTEHTAGPWDAAAMHAGPPTGLLVRALERTRPQPDRLLTRIAVDILGPVPVGEVAVRSRVVREGRSVTLLEAELSAHGRTVLRAGAWLLRTRPGSVPVPGPPRGGPRAAGQEPGRDPGATGAELTGLPHLAGYVAAMDWHFVAGAVEVPGPASVWVRQRVPLVPDEAPSGMQRLLTAGDSASGVSAVLDPRRWVFVNTDLTVHVHREPEGEWVRLDAETTVDPAGVGLATCMLADRRGAVGRGAQTLLVSERVP